MYNLRNRSFLKELEGEGHIARTRKTLRRTAALPAVTALDIPTDADPDNLHAFPANWNDDEGEKPRVIVEVVRPGYVARRVVLDGSKLDFAVGLLRRTQKARPRAETPNSTAGSEPAEERPAVVQSGL